MVEPKIRIRFVGVQLISEVVLFRSETGEVEITNWDVSEAFREAGERVSSEYEGIMRAQTLPEGGV